MNIQKLKSLLILTLLIFILSSCKGNTNPSSKEINSKNTSGNIEINAEKERKIQDFKKAGNYEEAISYYEEKLKIEDNEKNRIDLAETYLKYGNSYYKEEEYSKKALETLENLSDSTHKFYYVGYANEISKNYNRAILSYEKSLKLTKDDKEIANITNQIGHVYDLKGDFKKAGEYYLEAEKKGLNLPANLINRGRYEYRNKNYEEAGKYFQQVLEMNVDSFTNAEMYFNLGNIELNTSRNLEKVIELSNSGIQANSNYPNNYLNLALAYLQKGGELDKVEKELDKALLLNPNSTLGYKYKGIYYYVKDEFQNAIENFNKQYEVADKDAILMDNDRKNFKNEALYDIAKSYALLGDSENTILYLEKVLTGENKVYNYGFIVDYSQKDGPFSKLQTNKNFNDFVIKILQNSKQK